MGLIIGSLADNQIAALGIVKLLMPLFLTVPVVSMFVPITLKWIFYLFPNYWIFEALLSVYVSGYESRVAFPLAAALSFSMGLVILLVIMPKCARRFGLK